MISRKIVFPVFALLFTASFAFGQTEALKVVVNNLAFYKQQKDLKYLSSAKKSVDSLIKTHADSANLYKNVYKAIVYSSIAYIDSTNKLNQPPNFFVQTAKLVDDLSAKKKIYRFLPEMDFARRCIANVYMRHGFRQIRNSDFANALNSFTLAQKYAPSFKQLNAYIAFINNKLGRMQEAAKYYNTLLNSDTIKAEYVQAAASTYKSIGDTTKALEILQKGRKALPNDKLIVMEEANIYNNQRDYKSLEPLLPQLLDDNANNADIAFIAANCYDHLNKYDKAESLYLRAIELNSSAYDPVFNLGLLYLKSGSLNRNDENAKKDVVMAAQWLEKANEIVPNDTKCLQLLQMVYTKQGNENQLNRVNNQLKQLTNE